MNIVDFTPCHIEQARQLISQSYQEEQRRTPALPDMPPVPNLMPFAHGGLGVAACEGERLLGFLCSVPVFEGAFRSTDAVGAFSPLHANAAVPEDRARLYGRMYQAAGAKWAAAGASSHAVCLFAHDRVAQARFFQLGFGMRCVDAIRTTEPTEASGCEGYRFVELQPHEFAAVYPLHLRLDAHMAASPTFLLRPSDSEDAFLAKAAANRARFFAAKRDGRTVAYLRAERDGETWICEAPAYLHLTGAYCLPEHRGSGIMPGLLNLALGALKSEGYTHLGVDFESINPAAHAFWLKHFAAYTHSVVRRIDVHALR